MNQAIDYSKIADLYDAFVRETLDISFFLKESRKVKGKVLELMSGTGRVSIPLIEAGIPLTCVDYSPDMLKIFRKKLGEKNLAAPVFEMDVCKLDLQKSYDLIFIPFHSFAEILSPTVQMTALKAIHKHLTPNGRFICTLHNPPVRRQHVDGRLHLFCRHPHDDGTIMLWGIENADPDTGLVDLSEFIELYDAAGTMQTRRHVSARYMLHEKNAFQWLIEKAGFKLAALYGDYEYAEFDEQTSPFMIWILVK